MDAKRVYIFVIGRVCGIHAPLLLIDMLLDTTENPTHYIKTTSLGIHLLYAWLP